MAVEWFDFVVTAVTFIGFALVLWLLVPAIIGVDDDKK